MADSDWHKAVAQLAGVQTNPLDCHIPDQPPPHVRYGCFSNGDVEIDRIGEDYDFALVKRFRSERPSPHVLGPNFVVELPLLKMVNSYDEAALVQLDALRFLQGIRPKGPRRTSNDDYINPSIVNAVDYGRVGDAFKLANSKVAELTKIGVTPSLAVYAEVARIGMEEGLYSESLSVMEKGKNPRLYLRVAEGLAGSISQEIKAMYTPENLNSGAGGTSGCSCLLLDPRVLKAVGLRNADSHGVLGPNVRDYERLTCAAKAIVRCGDHSNLSAKFISLASDVFAALLVQIYRSQEVLSPKQDDDGVEAIALGFFAPIEAQEKSKASVENSHKGISDAGSQWLSSVILGPARDLRSLLRVHRPLTSVEEVLFSLLCLLAAPGSVRPKGVPEALTHGSQGHDDDSQGHISLLWAAETALRALDLPVRDCPVTGEIAGVFMHHLSANLDTIVRLCSCDGKVQRARRVSGSLFPEEPVLSTPMIPVLLWSHALRIVLTRVHPNTSIHILDFELITSVASSLFPYASALIEETSSDKTSTDSADERGERGVAVVPVVDALGSAVAVLAGSWCPGDGNTAITNMAFNGGVLWLNIMRSHGIMADPLDLTSLAVRWFNTVKGASCEGLIGVMAHWLKLMASEDAGKGLLGLRPGELWALYEAVNTLKDSAQSLQMALFTLRLLPTIVSSLSSSSADHETLVKLISQVYTTCVLCGASSGASGTSMFLEPLRATQDTVTKTLLANGTRDARAVASDTELNVLTRHAMLCVDVTQASSADDVVIQALTPRDTSALGLNVASPKPATFYMMIVDHTALDHLSMTNACLPPTAVSMSTEVNAFASLMVRYASAGGVLLCVPPAALACCSGSSIRMLSQWWRQRFPWVGVMPHSVLPVAAREILGSDQTVPALSADLMGSFLIASLMKKGGCVKTAILTANPTAYADALIAQPDVVRPSVINLAELLGKLVKK